jgi:LysM repeat protein
MAYKTHVKLLILILLAGIGLWGPGRAAAQEPPPNLLKNGSLEPPYYGQGPQTLTVPQGWNLWIGTGEPNALPHNDPLQVLDGAVAWSIKQSGVAFTAAGYQQVTVTPGTRLRASAWGRVFTCSDAIKSCAIAEPPYYRSDPSAGASLRVGIDPAGGLDPLAASVKWSAALAPYDQWSEMSVTAAAEGSTVTVFLHMTQAQGLVLNEVYWDKAALTVAGEDADTGTGEGEVPYVIPQGVRPDGSIVHIIQTGDTLWSIAYAYTDYGVTIASIAELNGIKTTTRFLQPGQEMKILPPGSVDPVTGHPVTSGAPRTPSVVTGTVTLPPEETGTPSPTPQVTRETEPLPVGGTAENTPTGTPVQTGTPEPTATREPTLTPTPEPTATPEPTLTPTPEPTAMPQEVAALTATQGTLCVTVYADANLNAARDPDEPPLAEAQIALAGADEETTHDYDGAADPLCLELAVGQYRVSAAVPGGFGLTTASPVVVALVGGREVNVSFGGAEGYIPPPVPAATESGMVSPGAAAPLIEESAKTGDGDDSTLDRLYDSSGLLVLGLAGLIAVGGVVALLLRKPKM